MRINCGPRLAGKCLRLRQDFTDAEATLHRQMMIIEKTFGAGSPRITGPLMALGSMAAGQKNYLAAEAYFSRALDVNQKNFVDNSSEAVESFRAMAGLYMVQSSWARAEQYLLRAVKAEEVANGADDPQVLIPLWGLRDLYDRWSKPEKAQPCWHRATGLMEKQAGENGPDLTASITAEVKALRQLGRTEEAAQLERRLAKLRPAAVETN